MMTSEQFLEKFMDIIQREEITTLDTELKDMPEWDSLAVLMIVSFLDSDFNIQSTLSEFQDFKTVGDIAHKAGVI